MEIKITAKQILKFLQILSWIIFIALCVEAGGIIFSVIYTFFINSINTKSFWEGADLSALYNFDKGQFLVVTFLMIIVSVLKALMFYLIVKLFIEKKLNMSQPFSAELRRFIVNVSWLSLGIGMFTHYGNKYSSWLAKKGINMPDAESLNFAGSDVWLFMAVILFVISQIVKRGIEIQNENDLTI